jgi:hypothetical protein
MSLGHGLAHSAVDPELLAVADELYRLDPSGDRFARVIRDTFDQMYDGQRTGHWNFAQLRKTEKTHMGTVLEINLQREFLFADGDATDYQIAGIQVDCKYSASGVWELPPEVIGHLALVVTANDERSTWRAGLVRVSHDKLNPGRNRDAKGTLSKYGRSQITALWPEHSRVAGNLFLELESGRREQIFSARARRGNQHGQARVNELFRVVQRRIIRRAELATVAMQDDPMKRARGNGGARTDLRAEGILVLGHQDNDPLVAKALGLAVPRKGEFISARVAPAAEDETPAARIGGQFWRLATDSDGVTAAPEIPRGNGAIASGAEGKQPVPPL